MMRTCRPESCEVARHERFRQAISAGAVAGATFFVPASSDAAIIYLSQQREIGVTAFVQGQPDSFGEQAPGFGDFNRAVTWPFSQNAGSGTVSQNSRLLPETILFEGAASVTTTNVFIDVGQAYSRLDTTFILTEAAPYSIVHSHWSPPGQGQRLALARLTGPLGVVFEWVEDLNVADTWPLLPVTGWLAQGQYSLHLEALVQTRPGFGGFEFGTTQSAAAFALMIPAPSALGPILIGVNFARRRRHC